MKRWRLIGGLLFLGGSALLVASCSSGGIDSVPESSAPLHSSGGGVYVSSADRGSQKIDVAMVTVHNAVHRNVRVLRVSPHIIGRLVFDGASLQSASDNNPGEGVTDAPFPENPGDTVAPITATRHPLVHAGANETLIVRVHVPPGKAGGGTLSVSVRYRTGGVVYSTTYRMPYVVCAEAFDGGTCTLLQDRVRAAADAA
jgi:hypothetical protein